MPVGLRCLGLARSADLRPVGRTSRRGLYYFGFFINPLQVLPVHCICNRFCPSQLTHHLSRIFSPRVSLTVGVKYFTHLSDR